MHILNRINDIAIIGGGLAGLCASIDLATKGFNVLVIEKKTYPFHKVCGEYLSNEISNYLQSLGLNLEALGAKRINRFMLSSHSGTVAQSHLKLGGLSMSRHLLDHQLYLLAKSLGVEFMLKAKIILSTYHDHYLSLKTSHDQEIQARVVLGAFGKKFSLNKKLTTVQELFVAFKNYYEGDFPDDLVAIHTFKGGYCGLSKVENGRINMTYMVTQNILKQSKSHALLLEKVLSRNKNIASFLENADPVWQNAISISNVSLKRKKIIDNHILMLGDSASMIAPICGNGMAMAIHSAYLASTQVEQFLNNTLSRGMMEYNYRINWNKHFSNRLSFSHIIQKIINHRLGNKLSVNILKRSSFLFDNLIYQTHGQAFFIQKRNSLIPQA